MREVYTNTYTHVVHICPDIAKTRRHPPWDRMKTKADYNARQSFDNLTRVCKPALRHHKRTADLILKHDKLIFVLSYLLRWNINWIRRTGWDRKEDRHRNNQSLRAKKKKNVLKEWDLASLCKNSIPCKHVCYYLFGAAWRSAGCTPAPLWSQTAAFTWSLSRRGKITTIVTCLSTRFIALW